MDIKILRSEKEIVNAVSWEIEEIIRNKPDALICLCAGHSPVPIMKQLVLDAQFKRYPSDAFKFISLDEWVGLGIRDSGSCIHDVTKYFLNPLGMEKGERVFFFDGLSKDLDRECASAADFIEKNGGIDVILLGIGPNGHIGFNEPPTKADDGVRVVELTETSKSVGAKYFAKKHKLRKGITLGILQIMGAKKIIVIAFGEHKQDIVHRAVTGEKSENCPISLIRDHSDIVMYFDNKAAKQLVARKSK